MRGVPLPSKYFEGAGRTNIYYNARMYSGNSVCLNETKIRWKRIFLEVCVHKLYYDRVYFFSSDM